jgi:hypothetical protein
MDLRNLTNNTAYLFFKNEELNNDNEIVEKIFEQEKLGEIQEILFLGTNYDYDSFKVTCNNISYVLKYSLDENCKLLSNEINIIKNNSSQWKPFAISDRSVKFGDIIKYSIQSFEFAESLEEAGIEVFFDNLDNFIDCYFSFQNNNLPSEKFNDHLIQILNDCSFECLTDEVIETLTERGELIQYENIVKKIKTEISSYYNIEIINQNNFCHGNIKLSNILFRNNSFKFINFTNSFKGNKYFDLSSIVFNLDLNYQQEKDLFERFLSKDYKIFSIKEWESYKTCYEINIRILFLKIIFDFLKEIYGLNGSRPSKITKLINLFILNSKRFLKINTLSSDMQFIYKSLLEPMIGSEKNL